MKAADMYRRLAAETDSSAMHVERILRAMVVMVREDVLRGGRVNLNGLGVFSRRSRKRSVTQHPQTGAPVKTPALTYVKFTPSKYARRKKR